MSLLHTWELCSSSVERGFFYWLSVRWPCATGTPLLLFDPSRLRLVSSSAVSHKGLQGCGSEVISHQLLWANSSMLEICTCTDTAREENVFREYSKVENEGIISRHEWSFRGSNNQYRWLFEDQCTSSTTISCRGAQSWREHAVVQSECWQ